ncbi:hypothetical protein AOLI_G00161780 [Acnodon oligacanthus]
MSQLRSGPGEGEIYWEHGQVNEVERGLVSPAGRDYTVLALEADYPNALVERDSENGTDSDSPANAISNTLATETAMVESSEISKGKRTDESLRKTHSMGPGSFGVGSSSAQYDVSTL